jgi:hypothetical protein
MNVRLLSRQIALSVYTASKNTLLVTLLFTPNLFGHTCLLISLKLNASEIMQS